MKSILKRWSETRPGDGQHLRLPPQTASRLVRWGLCGLLLAVAWGSSALAAPVSPKRVLVLGATSATGGFAQEVLIATGLGFQVDVVNGTAWGAMTATTGAPFDPTKGFSAYRAIILCDPNYVTSPSPLNAAEINRSVWSPTVTGNVIIDGADFTWHANYSPQAPAKTFIKNAILFATDDAANTGLFIQLSGYYQYAGPGTLVPVLDQLSLPANGPFKVRGGTFNKIHMTASHPALTGLTDALLSNFSYSSHETFDTWPTDFIPLAIATDSAPIYTGGSPPMSGAPYIMVRGTNVTSLGGCLSITNKAVDCISTNSTYAWTFCVTNNWNHAMQYLSFPDLPTGVKINPDVLLLNPALQPGQGTCRTLYLTNTGTATNFCFTIGVIATNFVDCCSITNCLSLVPCCAYVTNEFRHPIPGQPNCYYYYLQVKNVWDMDVSYIMLTPDVFNCLTFTPDILPLVPPLKPGETRWLNTTRLCVSPSCKLPQCFYMTLWNTNFTECCSIRHCLPKLIPPPIDLVSPADGSVFLTPTNIPLAADVSGEIGFSAVQFLANDQVIAIDTRAPFSATWSNVPPGDYVLRAEGVETNGGGLWSSDPVAIYVITGQTGTNVVGVPLLVGPEVRNGALSFMMQTAPGVVYELEASESFVLPNWQPVQTIIGEGGLSTVICPCPTTPQRFYRVRVR